MKYHNKSHEFAKLRTNYNDQNHVRTLKLSYTKNIT